MTNQGQGARLWTLFLSTVLLAANGCTSLLRSAAESASADTVDDLIVAIRRQPDPEIVRQGLPSVLLIIDGFLVASPDSPELLLAATNAYVSYCQAFLLDESENDRAVKLYTLAREYGLRLLRQRPFFESAFDKPMEVYEGALQKFTEDDVPAMHATASAWLGWIIADNESMEALVELPRALALTQRVLELDESYGDGSSHLAFAILFAIQPRGAGQDLERSRSHFERAIELAGPENFLPRVLYAEHFGKATLDHEFFVSTLSDVLAGDLARFPEHRLLNELARRRARVLLSQQEDFF